MTPHIYVEDPDHLSDERLELSEEEVADWIARLDDWDAEDRETWIETGMAIKHELGDAGLDIFLEFSRRCPDKFSLRVARQQYRSIKNKESRGRLITMRTVMQRPRSRARRVDGRDRGTLR
nr:PriCT-2 domain-containing protein [Jiella sp. LLJ827]